MPTFVVLAHNQPELLGRLCRRLAPHRVVVHVDRRVDLNPFRASVAGFADRVTFLDNRVPIAWAGFSLVQATIYLYREALLCTERGHHVVLLSGQCYPVRPIEEFVTYLSESGYGQHCHAVPLVDAPRHRHRKVARQHFLDLLASDQVRHVPLNGQRALRRISEAASLLIPGNALDRRVLYGSQWTAFTSECIDEMLRVADTGGWVTFFRRTFAPDEMFFHTVLHQSRFSGDTPLGGPEVFNVDGIAPQANFHLIDKSLIRTFVLSDRSEIEESKKYFVRHVRLPESASLLDALDAAASL